MANTPTAKKMIAVHEKRRKRNVSVRTQIKNTFRKAAEALTAGEGFVEAAAQAASCIDRAAAKGILHKNKAARRKSRLALKVKAAQAKA